MSVDKGRIILDSPNGSYFTGQTIHGKLIFRQEKVRKNTGILMRLRGDCNVHWTTEEYSFCCGRYIADHGGKEDYVNKRVDVMGTQTLLPGDYELPFAVRIPSRCPSSFEGKYGYVRYTLKAIVHNSWKEKSVNVYIHRKLDLNMKPSCKLPIEMEFRNTYCCCCLSVGATNTAVNVPLSGFCPGQTIPVEVTCNNTGSVEISSIYLYIKKKVTYRADGETKVKKETDIVAMMEKEGVEAGASRSVTVDFEVPPNMNPSVMEGCRFIDVDYKLKVQVEPMGCHCSGSISKEIIIGHVPLEGFQDNVQFSQHEEVVSQQPLSNMS